MDTVEDILYYVKRYFFPVLFFSAGVYLLFIALTPGTITVQDPKTLDFREVEIKQEPVFKYGAIVLILGSVVWFLYLLGIIKTMVGYGVMVFLAIGAIWVLYYDYAVVAEEVKFNNMYAERETEIKVRILDIKAAELAYKEANGYYTNSVEELINFIKTGKKMDFIKNGRIPERKITPEERDLIYGDDRPIDFLMTEEEATVIARNNGGKIDGKEFQRDTIFVPVMDAIFKSERYNTTRDKLGGKLAFHPDSIKYVPYSRDEVVIDTGSVMKGEYRVPTLLIKMTHPMEDPIDGYVDYSVGAVDDNHLRESWDK